jgi:hypothetical protein
VKHWNLLLVLACSLGCKSKPENDKPSPAASLALSAKPSGSAPLPTRPTEAAVKAFVARWEAAQNSGDFALYRELYAERFMGVKRVGQYSKRFDRAAWLVDRKPMLEARAQVKVSDLELAPSGGSTRAIFTQEFTSKSFKDTGKKELFLISGPGGLAISREEMLHSDVGASGAGDEAVLAYQRNGVVVQRGYDKAKLQGKPKLLSARNASNVEIGFDVATEALSPGAQAWLGKEVAVYAKDGKTCSARVSSFQVRVEASPHFGMRQSWNGELGAPKASPEQIASEVERMAQNHEHFVVGVLDKPCSGSWASAAPAPFVKPLAATGKLRQAGVAAFKALPAYVALQRQLETERKSTSAWETVDGELNAVELRATGKPALLVVTARGGMGCDAFASRLTAFWQVEGSAEAPQLTAVGQPLATYLALQGALDEGAAGLALLVGPYDIDDQVGVVRPTAGKNAERILYSIAFWDCGC